MVKRVIVRVIVGLVGLLLALALLVLGAGRGWLGNHEEPGEATQIELAYAAISKIDQLAQGGDHEPVIAVATSLLERLSELRPASGPAADTG